MLARLGNIRIERTDLESFSLRKSIAKKKVSYLVRYKSFPFGMRSSPKMGWEVEHKEPLDLPLESVFKVPVSTSAITT